MKRTVSIPVNLPRERFLPLMGFCAEIFNQHVDWSLAHKTYNKNRAHKDLYSALRLEYSQIPSALLQTVRDNIRDNYILSSTRVDGGAGHSQLPNRSGHAHLVCADDQLQAPSLYGWGGWLNNREAGSKTSLFMRCKSVWLR